MKISKKEEYALRSLLYLIENERGEPISIKTIAEREGISALFLEQIFYILKKSGIIASQRGVKGGFRLLKKAEEISVYDILFSISSETYLIDCLDDDYICERKNHCVNYLFWNLTDKKIKTYFKSITLKDLVNLSRKGEAFVDIKF